MPVTLEQKPDLAVELMGTAPDLATELLPDEPQPAAPDLAQELLPEPSPRPEPQEQVASSWQRTKDWAKGALGKGARVQGDSVAPEIQELDQQGRVAAMNKAADEAISQHQRWLNFEAPYPQRGRAISEGEIVSIQEMVRAEADLRGVAPLKSEHPMAGAARGEPIGVKETLAGMDWQEYLPVVGPAKTMVNALALHSDVKYLQKEQEWIEEQVRGDVKKFKISPDKARQQYYSLLGQTAQARRVYAHLQKQKEVQRRGVSFAGQVTAGVAELPAYMIEFLASGGFATLGKGAAKKAAVKMLGKSISKKALGQVAVKTAGWIGGAAARTGTVMQARVGRSYAERRLGEYEFAPTGELKTTKEGETPFAAAWKAVLDIQIEMMSEVAGGAIVAGGGRILGRIPGTKNVLATVGKNIVKLKGGTGAIASLRKLGYHGLVGEMSEEQLGRTLRAITGVEPLETAIPTAEQLGVEAAVLAAPSVLGLPLRAAEQIGRPTVAEPTAPEVTPEEAPRTEEVREDAGQVPETGVEPEPSEVEGREDIQRPEEARPEARVAEVPQEEVGAVPRDSGGAEIIDLEGQPVTLNADGTISLYHRTSTEAATRIRETGEFVSAEEGRVFASTARTGQAEGFGPETIEIRARPEDVRLEDAFRGGEIHISMFAEQAKVAQPTVAAPEVAEKPAEKAEELVTKGQLAHAQQIAESRALISEKGKPKPGYRKLARSVTGKPSMAKMTKDEAREFISALSGLPEAQRRKGKLVPPSIPRTTKLARVGEFAREYRKPTPLRLFTPQNYYAEVLGVKHLVKPLEEAKQQFDLEYRKAANEVDKWVRDIDRIAKTTRLERARAKLRNRPTRAVVRMWELLDKYEQAPDFLSEQEREIFTRFRNLSQAILARENEVRRSLDMPEIKERKAYVRHVADGMAKEMLEGRYPFPEGARFYSQKIVGKKIYNPMELQRELSDELSGIFSRDLGYATKSMLWTSLKEVHLSQPLRFFTEQMGAVSKDMPTYKPYSAGAIAPVRVIPAATKKWAIDYVNMVIKGQETALDEHVNRIVTESGLSGVFNKILAPFGRSISKRPVTRTFQKGGRLIISGVMGWRPKQLIRNMFQRVQCLGLYTTRANLKGFLPVTGVAKDLINKSNFYKSYTGYEELPQGAMRKMERRWLAPYQWTAASNAKHAMKVAYWDTAELITDPKYKDLGWADSKRTYKEKQGVFYETEKVKLLREMEFGASATQYQYIPMGMPEAFRHKTLIPLTRLQSWWMNYFAKFNREAAHRFFKGETMYGAKLPWTRRIGWFRYLIFGGLILNTLGYWRSYLFGVAPTAIPPAAQLALAAYTYLASILSPAADEPWEKKRRAEAKWRLYRSLKTFVPGYLAWRDFEAVFSGRRSLKSLFFYTKTEPKKTGRTRRARRRSR